MSLTMFDVGNSTPCNCGAVMTGVVCVAGSPAGVPQATIQVSWVSSGIFGNGSANCTWNGISTWLSPCITAGTHSMRFEIVAGGPLVLGLIIFNNATCALPSASSCTLSLTSYAECPFSVSGNTTGVACPAWTTYGFSSVAFNDPVNECCSTTVIIAVRGCVSGAGLPGATVSIVVGATTISSGTTDASGDVTLATQGYSDTTYTITVTAPRFADYAALGDVNPITMTPAAGYVCCNFGGTNCAYPLPTTLHCTFANAGAQVFSSSGGAWTASFTYLTIAYVITLNTNASMTATAAGVGFTCTFILGGCPFGFAGTIIPSGIGAVLGGGTITE